VEKQISILSEEFTPKTTKDLSLSETIVEESIQKCKKKAIGLHFQSANYLTLSLSPPAPTVNASLKKEAQLTFSRQSQRKLLEDIHRTQARRGVGPRLSMDSPAIQSDRFFLPPPSFPPPHGLTLISCVVHSFLDIFPNVWPNDQEDPELVEK